MRSIVVIFVFLSLIAHPSWSNPNWQHKQDSVQVLAVAQTIFNEARGESYMGKLAVATVIFNRATTKNKSFMEIVMEPHQFAYSTPKERPLKSYQECLTISRSLHDGSFRPLGSWNCFFNPDKCTPYWFKKMANKCRIGHHLFGKIKL